MLYYDTKVRKKVSFTAILAALTIETALLTHLHRGPERYVHPWYKRGYGGYLSRLVPRWGYNLSAW